jgi:DNA-directed RNA polymerase subunit omega
MNADLVKAASEVITNPQILVNMISRRVRQLSLGHRPLVEHAPGLREADIALTESRSEWNRRRSGPRRAVPRCRRRQENGGEEKSGLIRSRPPPFKDYGVPQREVNRRFVISDG